jgi:hypothetical protein
VGIPGKKVEFVDDGAIQVGTEDEDPDSQTLTDIWISR